jgi:hypothetical protein
MNPYLVQPSEWENIYNSIIVAVRDDIARQFSSDDFVSMQSDVYIQELPGERGPMLVKPDV